MKRLLPLTFASLLLAACSDQPSSAPKIEVTDTKASLTKNTEQKNSVSGSLEFPDTTIVHNGIIHSVDKRTPSISAFALLGLGQSLLNVDLVGTTSKAEIIKRLKAHAANMAPGQWLLGRGWDQNDWEVKELPTAADLDVAFPDRPVWLERVDGHAGWANSKAMQGPDRYLNTTWQPEGGEVVRDGNNKATGVFIDNASELVQIHVPEARWHLG